MSVLKSIQTCFIYPTWKHLQFDSCVILLHRPWKYWSLRPEFNYLTVLWRQENFIIASECKRNRRRSRLEMIVPQATNFVSTKPHIWIFDNSARVTEDLYCSSFLGERITQHCSFCIVHTRIVLLVAPENWSCSSLFIQKGLILFLLSLEFYFAMVHSKLIMIFHCVTVIQTRNGCNLIQTEDSERRGRWFVSQIIWCRVDISCKHESEIKYKWPNRRVISGNTLVILLILFH